MADQTFTTKNYGVDGGDRWVIGGTLEVLSGATVTGITGASAVAANQPASAADSVAALVTDFNALLSKLKTAGLMTADA